MAPLDLIGFAAVVIVLLLIRVACVLVDIRRLRSQENSSWHDRRKTPVKTMIVLGSGGHTTEMIKLVSCLSDNYTPRHYVVANTDALSREKAIALERRLTAEKGRISQYYVSVIPRSREVKQSWLSTVFSTLYAIIYSFHVVLTTSPDLLLCNGPGTCVPLCAVAFLLRVFFIKKTRIVFIESICRVESLSLSGLLLYHVADEFFVQWPPLQKKYSLAKYMGRIV